MREGPEMTRSTLVDVTVQVHHQTDRWILVSDDGDVKRAVWLPLSQIEIEIIRDDTAEVTMPEWLAQEKGLI